MNAPFSSRPKRAKNYRSVDVHDSFQILVDWRMAPPSSYAAQNNITHQLWCFDFPVGTHRSWENGKWPSAI